MNTIDNDTGEVIEAKPVRMSRPVKVKAPHEAKPRAVIVRPAPVHELIGAVMGLHGLPAQVEQTITEAAQVMQKHGKGIAAGALIGAGLFAALEMYERSKKENTR